jgi:inosine-uridine nucleoside N-ribohydrolase
MINLDEHKVFVKPLQMEMVPLSVAKQAVEQAAKIGATDQTLNEVKDLISQAVQEYNNAFKSLNDND